MQEWLEGMGALVVYIANGLVYEDATVQWINLVPDDLQQITYEWVGAVIEWSSTFQ